MKSLPSCILACGLALSMSACSADIESPAAPIAAKPAATKTAPTKTARDARKSAVAPSVQAASAFPFETAPRNEPSTPRKEPKKTRAIQSDDLTALESRGLLRWLPLDSWAVLRVPHVELLGELPSRCGIASLFQGPLAAMALAGPDSPLGKMQSELHAQAPELDRLIELLPNLHGELVVGLTQIAPPTKPDAGGTPLTAALVFSAQSDADAIRDVFDAYLGRLQKEDAKRVQRIDGAWGYRMRFNDARVELRRTGDVYTAVYCSAGEPAASALPSAERAPADSFAASSVVSTSPDLNAGGQGVIELYLNATPGLELARSAAPDDANEILENLGVYDIEGLSFAMGLGQKGVSEALTWCAPTHEDVVSRAFAGKAANRELARWIPADATTAGLYSVDLAGVFDGIAESLPKEDLTAMTRALSEVKTNTGIDIYQDVVKNVGPSLAIVSRGDPLALMNGFSGMCFVLETKDGDKTQRLIDALAAMLPPDLRAKTAQVAGRSVQSLDLRALGVALSSISWCRVDGALLVATDNKMLERCLTAGATAGVKQPDLAAALASEDVIGAGLSAAVGDMPKTLTVLRKHANGFTLSSHDGAGAMGGGSVAVLPIIASIAIPKLLSARLSANEAAAFSTMRSISSAEAQTQASGAIDIDGDGVGEYGFLGEMAGAVPLRGTNERLDPAVLSPSMGATQNGVLTRSGYMFQVWLPAARGNGGVYESKQKDGKDVNTEAAEVNFLAYCWPLDAGNTGNRVWALRSNVMYACQNPGGKYSSAEHMPKSDAMWPAKKGVDPESGEAYIGRDGLTWQVID